MALAMRQVPNKTLPPVPPPRPPHMQRQSQAFFVDVSKRQSYPSPKTQHRPAPFIKDDTEVIELRKKVAHLEKMQDMYKARIAELENQVSNFSVFHILNNPAVKHAQNGKPVNLVYKKDLPAVPGQSIFYKRVDPYNSDNEPNTEPNTEPSVDSQLSFQKVEPTYKETPKASVASYSNLAKVGSNDINPIKEKKKLLALYDYVAPTEVKGRLSFKEGDVLFLISKGAKNGWWIAEHSGVVGKIPSNFVEELDSTMFFTAKIIKQFLIQQPGDLEVHRGELVTVLKKQENGWYLGEKKGVTGFFPSNCAERVFGLPPLA